MAQAVDFLAITPPFVHSHNILDSEQPSPISVNPDSLQLLLSVPQRNESYGDWVCVITGTDYDCSSDEPDLPELVQLFLGLIDSRSKSTHLHLDCKRLLLFCLAC